MTPGLIAFQKKFIVQYPISLIIEPSSKTEAVYSHPRDDQVNSLIQGFSDIRRKACYKFS